MTLSEIKKRLQQGSIIRQEFYPKKTYQSIMVGSVLHRITNSQWDKISPLLVKINSRHGIITEHYYKLKQQ